VTGGTRKSAISFGLARKKQIARTVRDRLLDDVEIPAAHAACIFHARARRTLRRALNKDRGAPIVSKQRCAAAAAGKHQRQCGRMSRVTEHMAPPRPKLVPRPGTLELCHIRAWLLMQFIPSPPVKSLRIK